MNSAPKRDTHLVKNSIRSTFRSFSILRSSSSDALFLNFIKEKKREKMFQKLGMKKGQVILSYIVLLSKLRGKRQHELVTGCFYWITDSNCLTGV